MSGGAGAIRGLFLSGRRLGPAQSLLLLTPFFAILFVAFLMPIGLLIGESFLVPEPGLHNYRRVLEGEPYVRVFFRTLRIAALVTLVTLLLGYPLAYAMTRAKGLALALMIAAVLLPLWTSVLVRTFAWMVLFQRNGLINQGLQAVGLTEAPIRLLFTEGAVVVAMAHVLLPFMVLPLYAALRGIPEDYSRAAMMMGASPTRTFVEVTLPLSAPGIASGSLMVFLLSLGFFVTPALIGGPQQMMIATLVSQQVRELINWPFAGALVGLMLAFVLVLTLVFNRLVSLDRFVGGKP